jgi:hypothetical protein
LRKQLADAKIDMRVQQLMKREDAVSIFRGEILACTLRLRKALRRRMPTWPQFEGTVL